MAADQQPALATTKRKFHKLVDNLTASTSTTSLASTLHHSNASDASLSQRPGDSPEPLTKRPRSSEASMERQRQVSAGQERIRALKEQLLTPGRKGTMRVVGTESTPSAADSTPRKAPNFQPYSQEQFLDRLKSFADVKKWSTKPNAISEVEWAKRGWSCDTWNTVACKGGCEKRVAVKLRPKRKDANGREIETSEDLAVEVDDALVQRYAELVVDGHSEDCLWRKRGCQDDIYHIPIASRAKSTAELLNRYNFLKAISADLPLPHNITHPGPPIDVILARIGPTYFSPAGTPAPASSAEKVAFAFALFGWTGVSESRIALAVCTHCFQRLGLWLSSDARLREMAAKLEVSVTSLRLNLVEAHREHCPWKNGAVQNNADGPIAGMSAWETLQFMVLKRRGGGGGGGGESESGAHGPGHGHGHGHGHARGIESVDLGSDVTFPRGSVDGESMPGGDDDEGSLNAKWKKFKAKLRRTTSKKSLKSVKSVKSSKSVKSGKSGKDD